MIRVIIADDHKIFLQGLVSLLKSTNELEVAGTATEGATALRMILEIEPDIAVLDISMPEMDGIQVAQNLQKQSLKTQIIFLTYHRESLIAGRALQAGGKGFLLKENAFDELLQAIKTVRQGGIYVSPSIANELISDQFNRDGTPPKLTKREEETLRWITLGKSNKEIGALLHISVKTVETHRAHILAKLNTNNVMDLVRYALRTGLIDLYIE